MKLTSFLLAGLPNVGKSLLFNKLTRTRNAIVSDYGLLKMFAMDIALLMTNRNVKLLILQDLFLSKIMF